MHPLCQRLSLASTIISLELNEKQLIQLQCNCRKINQVIEIIKRENTNCLELKSNVKYVLLHERKIFEMLSEYCIAFTNSFSNNINLGKYIKALSVEALASLYFSSNANTEMPMFFLMSKSCIAVRFIQ